MQLIFPRRFRVAGQGAAPAMTSGQDKRTVTSSLDALTLRDVERIDFDAFSRHFALELRRDVTFLAPTVVVDYVSDNDTRRVLRNSRSSERCVYTGSVMADADSRVTVTFCPHLVRARDNQTRDLQNKWQIVCFFFLSFQSGHIVAFNHLYTIQHLSNASYSLTRSTSQLRHHSMPSNTPGELLTHAVTSLHLRHEHPVHNYCAQGERLLSFVAGAVAYQGWHL